MANTQFNTDDKGRYSDNSHEEYYNRILLQEQPFYRDGMSSREAREELEYLNANLDSFFEGKYQPLWKQSTHKSQIS